jgi:protocatechuate 3,4-dioxygenase beta subunit
MSRVNARLVAWSMVVAMGLAVPSALAQVQVQVPPPPPLPPGMPPNMAPPRDAVRNPGTARIRGRVLAADTGQPLRKAQVRASAPDLRENRVTSTDADGRFELKELPAGRYTVFASKGSYVAIQYGQLRPFTAGKPIELRDGETVERVDVALPRGGIVTGRVVDEFGEPVADVGVAPMRYQYMQGRRRLTPSGRPGMTNDIGEFRLFGLPPGQYYLSATLRGGMFMLGDSDDRSGYAPTYYPGTPNVAEAQRLTIGVGQALTDINLALVPARTTRITGTAIDSSGKPMSGGFVSVIQSTGGGFMSSTGGQIKPDGTFTVSGVAPGEYTLRAQAMGGFGETPEFASTHVIVAGEDISGVLLAVQKAVTVSGRVVVPAGAQSFRADTVRIVASPADPEQMMFGPGAGGKINDDLTFEVKMPPGRSLIRLLARTAGDWSTRAERLNGVDVTDTGLDLRPGEDVSGLEIELTNQQSQVTGTVSNSRGQVMKDYSVVVFSRDREKWSYVQTRYVKPGQPDQDGRFKVTGLPAGDYYAVAVDYVDFGEMNDPEFLDRVKDRATAFSLDEGGTKVLDLKLSSST